MLSDDFSDEFLDKALEVWSQNSDKHDLLTNIFRSKEDSISELYKSAHLCKQLIAIIEGYPKSFLKWCSDSYSIHLNNSDVKKYPIHAFLSLYNLITNNFNGDFTHKSNVLSLTLQSFISQLQADTVSFDETTLNYDTVECPFCNSIAIRPVKGKKSVIRCGKCKELFLLDREIVNTAARTRSMRLKKAEIDRVHYKAGYDEGKKDERKLSEATCLKRIEELRTQYEEKIREQQMLKYFDGKIAAKKDFLKALPNWLRWLVQRYVK